jgi:glucose/arabinose dehydrogenase
MKHRQTVVAVALAALLLLAACQKEQPNSANGSPPAAPTEGTKPAPPAGANSPLPADGFKATISVPEAPSTIKAGEKVLLQVKVKNNGPALWPAIGQPDHKYQVNLGNHWYDRNEKPLVNDDARSPLPRDIQPNEEVTLPLRVTAPAAPGDYVLELDMVQELVGWFKQKGGQTFKLKVKVE